MSDRTKTPNLETNRRTLLALLAGGAAGGLVAGRASAQDVATPDIIECAEALFDVSYTQAERAQMVEGMDQWISGLEQLRAQEKPNGLAPALHFDPRLPGKSYREQASSVTGIPANAGPFPSNETDIAYAPAWKQALWMADGHISSEELTWIYLNRIEAHAGTLECFVTVMRDEALAEARQMDAERAAGQFRGPLHGIPYAVKDLVDVAGQRSTWGSTIHQDQMADTTSVIAERLKAAGAVLLGKTTLGALAYGDIWFGGVTRNPFVPSEGSSGSSAGSASATAAGLCSFAIGTETLGSIVSPSHRCGTTGLRPTFGRVPRSGAMALCWSLDKIGPIVRSVPDTALVLAALNGSDDLDPSALDHGFEARFGQSVRGLKVGYNPAWFEAAEDPDRAALEVARDLGVELIEFDVDELPYDTLVNQLIAEGAAAFENMTLENLDDELRWQTNNAWPNSFRRMRFFSAIDLINTDRFRRQVMAMMHEKLSGLDAVIGPNFAGNMLTITNFTGQPQLAFRSGFVERTAQQRFEGPEPSEETVSAPYATSLWAPLFEEGTILNLGFQIEQALGVASVRPPQFS